MDSFEKGLQSPKNPPDSSSSGESNENDVSHNESDSNSKSENPKKSVMKHFMSPTASAKSKVVPRKKILAEKNESLTCPENAHVPKFPNFSARNEMMKSCHQISTTAVSVCSYTSKSDDEELTSSAHSSLKPYDPLTNYLCPRPKYLLYKPNRGHEILLPRYFGVKEDNSFLSINPNSVDEEKTTEFDPEPLTSPLQEGSSEIPTGKDNDYDGEDTDDEEEEDEEFVEEQGWSLKGMVKFLLLLVVTALSTSYISTMNGPTPSPVVTGIGFLRDGFYRTHRRLFEPVSANVQIVACVNGSGMQALDAQTGFLEVNRPFVNKIVQMIEQCDGLTGDISDPDEIEEDWNWSDWETAGYEDADGGKEGSDDQLSRWESSESDVATDKELKKLEDDFGGLHQCAALDDNDTQSASDVETAEYEDADGGKEGSDDLPRWEGSESDVATDKELKKVEDDFGVLHQCAALDDTQSASDVETTEYEDADGGKEGSDDQLWESSESDVATDKELKMVEDDFQGLHHCAALDDTQSASGIEHDNQISEGNQLENYHNTNEGSFGVKKSEEMARIGSERAADTARSMEDEICHQDDEVEGSSTRKSGANTLETKWQTSKFTAWCVEDTVFVPAVMDSNNKELDASGIDLEVESMQVAKYIELGPISIAAIWFSFLSIVLASLVCIYSRRLPFQASLQDSFHEISDRKEELISVQLSMEFENRQEKAESIETPSSALYSFEETTTEYAPIQAPDVELLGEFVIGEYSSSVRSCGRKGGGIIETEESINPIYCVARVESRTPPSPEVRLLNVSNTDSSSYGSFTAVKAIHRKEGGRDGSAKLVSTPVRRSSRLRNLSASSPSTFTTN